MFQAVLEHLIWVKAALKRGGVKVCSSPVAGSWANVSLVPTPVIRHQVRFAPIPAVLINILVARKLPFPI